VFRRLPRECRQTCGKKFRKVFSHPVLLCKMFLMPRSIRTESEITLKALKIFQYIFRILRFFFAPGSLPPEKT